jgi:preprotein translocase SecF subunit
MTDTVIVQGGKTPSSSDLVQNRFPFMKYRYHGFAVTTFITLATIALLFFQGLNLGLDFTGGVLIEAEKQNTVFDAAALRGSLDASGLEEFTVQLADQDKTALIRVPLTAEGEEAVRPIREAVTQAIGADARIERTETVGPQVSGELLRGGVIAALLAVVMIAVYVWFRFESKFGIAALITTFHDVFVITGLFALTHMTFDLTIVAALLTVAGYSINDTVVVFDRIRETMRKHKRMSLNDIIDEAITATLSRTVVTGCTTLIACLAILLFAGPVLYGFAAAIICGVLVGTYSSIFVAAPLLIHLPGKLPGGKEGEEQRAAAGKSAQTPVVSQ